MIARNAKQQHDAMLQLLRTGLEAPVLQRFEIAADLMAAQITFDGMLLNEIDDLRARLDLADARKAKAESMLRAYAENAVAGGLVPRDVADEFLRNIEETKNVNG